MNYALIGDCTSRRWNAAEFFLPFARKGVFLRVQQASPTDAAQNVFFFSGPLRRIQNKKNFFSRSPLPETLLPRGSGKCRECEGHSPNPTSTYINTHTHTHTHTLQPMVNKVMRFRQPSEKLASQATMYSSRNSFPKGALG